MRGFYAVVSNVSGYRAAGGGWPQDRTGFPKLLSPRQWMTLGASSGRSLASGP